MEIGMLEVFDIAAIISAIVSAMAAISLLVEFLIVDASLPKRKRALFYFFHLSILFFPCKVFDYEKGSEKEASLVRRSSIFCWFFFLSIIFFLTRIIFEGV